MASNAHFAVDGNEANVPQRVGSNVYAFELLHALEQRTRDDERIQWTILLSSPALQDLPSERPGWQYLVIGPRPLWTQWALPIHLFFHQHIYTAFFTPGHYAPRVSAVPYISSVMDLAFLSFPKQFRKKDSLQLKEWTRYSVRHATKVLTISKATRKDICATYSRKKTDVIVGYPALPSTIQSEKAPLSWLKNILHEDEEFFLYVGTLQPRKNIPLLINAYEQFCAQKKKKSPIHLIIAGKVGWLAQPVLDAVVRSPYAHTIHLLGYVDEGQKKLLYAKSKALILLGEHEGFGLPPLEAMAFGTIPIVSDKASLPEVVGDAGYIVQTSDVDQITATLEEVAGLTAKQRAKQLKLCREQAAKFQWEQTAQAVLTALKNIRSGKQ